MTFHGGTPPGLGRFSSMMNWLEGRDPAQPGATREPRAEHSEHCPFCGADFDVRDLAEVFKHYDHQVAAGAPTAIEIGRDEGIIRWEGSDRSWFRIIDFYRDLKTTAVRRHDGTLDVETADGWLIVRTGGWLVRRDDGSVEVYPP